jgi:anti-anti-sigma factor
LEREDKGDVSVVRFKTPRLRNDETTEEIFRQIAALVDTMGRRNLVLDLGSVEYAASLAVGKLVLLNHKAQAAQGRLALCRLTPAVTEVLEVTHLKDRFNLFASEQEAIGSFA